MAIPFWETGRTQTEHCSNRHKIYCNTMESVVLAQEFADKSMKWSEKPINRLEYALKFSV